ncbi:MAG: hypothetical protein ABR573_04790 [Candidatus Dormibacteria bacterium]
MGMKSFFTAIIAATSMVGFTAMTASAASHTANNPGKAHDKGGVASTPTSVQSTGGPTSVGGSTTGAGAGSISTPAKTGPHDSNPGDTWLQTVGPCIDHNAEVLNHDADAMSSCNNAAAGAEFEPPAEPTAENLQYGEIGTVEDVNPDQNPHLPCANIEVMGKDMGDTTGSYSIDYWPPTGDKGGVYGKNSDGSTALSKVLPMTDGDPDVTNNGTWNYNQSPTLVSKMGKKGGYQVMDIIDVSALVHNAQMINPDPHDIQGYHFKLQFSQDPQKHKTFWVKCAAPVTAPVTSPPSAETGSVQGVVYLCDANGNQTSTPAPGTVTIGSVSGASPQTATDLTPGSSQVVAATAGDTFTMVNCGAPTLSEGCDVSGIDGSGTVTVPVNSTATVCFYEQAPSGNPEGDHTGSVQGVVYLCDANGNQTSTPALGAVTIGSVSGASPQTATGLTSGSSQVVTATAGGTFTMVNCGAPTVSEGCDVSGMNGSGTVTVPVNSTATVCFYEQAGGGLGAGGTQGVNGVQAAATAQNPPVGGVLGASTTMPLTGTGALLRLVIAMVCLVVGFFLVRTAGPLREQ